ncbi:MAG: SRPBCC family protein [Myxococcota bacterium]
MSHDAEKSIIAPVPIDDFYQTVVDYLAYPHITDEVKSAHIVSRDGPVSIVHFTAKIMFRSFDYTLRMVEDRPHGMSWTFVSSNTLTENRGWWKLEAISPHETKVTYWNELGARSWLPNGFINALARVVLPRVLRRWSAYAQAQIQARSAARSA